MNTEFIKIILNKYLILILIVTFAFMLRIPYRLPNLDDWDSVQFALALHDYSVAKDQPHLPGYPLYIVSARAINFVIRNDTYSLTLLSAILGSLSVIPLYLLAQELFNKQTAILSALFYIALPVQWTLSEQALSDIPGIFFLILIIFFIYHFRKSKKALFICAFFGGLILGFRLNELPVIIFSLEFYIIKESGYKNALFALLIFSLGIFSWVIPMVALSGVRNFEAVLWRNFYYVVWHDGGLALTQFTIKHLLYLKVSKAYNLINLGYTLWFAVPSVVSFGWVLITKKWKEERFQFLIVWLISYVIFLLTIYNLELPRFVLPLSPPLIIILVSFIFEIKDGKYLQPVIYIFFGLIFIILTMISWKEVKILNKTLSPTMAPVIYVKNHFNKGNTVVIASRLYRQFEYYLPNFKVYNSGSGNIPSDFNGETVIIDHPSLKNEFSGLKHYYIASFYYFSAPAYLYPKTPSITLYILKQH